VYDRAGNERRAWPPNPWPPTAPRDSGSVQSCEICIRPLPIPASGTTTLPWSPASTAEVSWLLRALIATRAFAPPRPPIMFIMLSYIWIRRAMRNGQPRWASSTVQCHGTQARPPVSRADEDNEELVFAIHSGHTATVRRISRTACPSHSGGRLGSRPLLHVAGYFPNGPRSRRPGHASRCRPWPRHAPEERHWLRDRCARWDEDA
jgi:hypothetical protein